MIGSFLLLSSSINAKRTRSFTDGEDDQRDHDTPYSLSLSQFFVLDPQKRPSSTMENGSSFSAAWLADFDVSLIDPRLLAVGSCTSMAKFLFFRARHVSWRRLTPPRNAGGRYRPARRRLCRSRRRFCSGAVFVVGCRPCRLARSRSSRAARPGACPPSKSCKSLRPCL